MPAARWVGGETAGCRGCSHGRDYDLAGFSSASSSARRSGRAPTSPPATVVIGLPSAGLHSNGHLARTQESCSRRSSGSPLDALRPELGGARHRRIAVAADHHLRRRVRRRCAGRACVESGGAHSPAAVIRPAPRSFRRCARGRVDRSNVAVPPIMARIARAGGDQQRDQPHVSTWPGHGDRRVRPMPLRRTVAAALAYANARVVVANSSFHSRRLSVASRLFRPCH